MTKSQNAAYDEVVRSLFKKGPDAEKRRDLLTKGGERSSAEEREVAYATVREAIIKKTPSSPNDWVTAAEAAVFVGAGGSPRTLANARRRNELSAESRAVRRNSSLPGLAGRGSGRSVRYHLADLDQWKKKLAVATKDAAVAASSSSRKFSQLDAGIHITTLEELLRLLPWLVEDDKLISSVVVTRYSVKEFSQFMAAGAEIAWFSLHDAMTKWVWISKEDRLPWSAGYRKILDGAASESRRYDEVTKASALAESMRKMFSSGVKARSQRIIRRPAL